MVGDQWFYFHDLRWSQLILANPLVKLVKCKPLGHLVNPGVNAGVNPGVNPAFSSQAHRVEVPVVRVTQWRLKGQVTLRATRMATGGMGDDKQLWRSVKLKLGHHDFVQICLQKPRSGLVVSTCGFRWLLCLFFWLDMASNSYVGGSIS
jgi:hypothetical protein